MALIKCPECKKKISDQCGSCPHCGYPVQANSTQKVQEDNNVKPSGEKKEKKPIIKTKVIKERKPINKKKVAIVSGIAVFVLLVGSILGYNILKPRIKAVKEYKKVVEKVEQQNSDLEKSIVKSEKLINKKQPLLDETLISALENAISDAKAEIVTDFKVPSRVDEIIAKTKKLKSVNYKETLENLEDKHNALEIDAKRYQLVNKPTEAYVIKCLKTVSDIVNVSAVTEDNDPNGNLNKEGGYTSTVYIAHKDIKLDTFVHGKTLIEQGTDAGGAIEVYTCEEDAVKRKDYLAAFDGGIFASGTHTVIGTVLVRTSNELTATQQKDFEAKIIAALTYIEEVDGKKEIQVEEKTAKEEKSTQEEKPAETKPTETEPATQSNKGNSNNTNKTPSTASAVGSYKHVKTGSECNFSLHIYADGTFMWSNDDVSGLTSTGTWTQSGSSVTFEEYSIAGDQTFYYKDTYTLYSDGIKYGDWYYTRN